MNTQQDFDNAAEQWLRQHRFTSDPQTLNRIGLRVQENLEKLGGYVSSSSYERAYLELVAEKAIKPFRGTVSEHASVAPAVSPEIIEFIENPRTSAWEMSRRYNSDPTFRRQYDLYEKSKKQRPEQQSGVVSLTAEEYHRIPAVTIAARYQRDRSFKLAVDKLIAEGKI
jgi:hypothetical protein